MGAGEVKDEGEGGGVCLRDAGVRSNRGSG